MKKERILVIKLGALGDFILMMGRMLWIKKCHPQASLTLMTGGMYVQLARPMGIFDSYIIDNRKSYWNLADKFRLYKELKAGEFDYIYDLQGTSRTRTRYFFAYTRLVRKPCVWIDIPNMDRRTVTPAGFFGRRKVETEPLKVASVAKHRLEFLKASPELLESLPRPYVLMIPGCSPSHPHKRWPAESFATLAVRLAEHGIHTVVIGTKAEAEAVECVAKASPMVLNLLNKVSMTDIPDLARNALVSVGNDTGPSHMAAHTESPLIGLFAARKKPCSLRGEQTFNIISSGPIGLITPDEVWSAMHPYIAPHFNNK